MPNVQNCHAPEEATSGFVSSGVASRAQGLWKIRVMVRERTWDLLSIEKNKAKEPQSIFNKPLSFYQDHPHEKRTQTRILLHIRWVEKLDGTRDGGHFIFHSIIKRGKGRTYTCSNGALKYHQTHRSKTPSQFYSVGFTLQDRKYSAGSVTL